MTAPAPEAPTTSLPCPGCRSPLALVAALHGRQIACHHCGSVLRVSASPWEVVKLADAPQRAPVALRPPQSALQGCPRCRHPLILLPALDGKTITCRNCGARLRVQTDPWLLEYVPSDAERGAAALPEAMHAQAEDAAMDLLSEPEVDSDAVGHDEHPPTAGSRAAAGEDRESPLATEDWMNASAAIDEATSEAAAMAALAAAEPAAGDSPLAPQSPIPGTGATGVVSGRGSEDHALDDRSGIAEVAAAGAAPLRQGGASDAMAAAAAAHEGSLSGSALSEAARSSTPSSSTPSSSTPSSSTSASGAAAGDSPAAAADLAALKALQSGLLTAAPKPEAAPQPKRLSAIAAAMSRSAPSPSGVDAPVVESDVAKTAAREWAAETEWSPRVQRIALGIAGVVVVALLAYWLIGPPRSELASWLPRDSRAVASFKPADFAAGPVRERARGLPALAVIDRSENFLRAAEIKLANVARVSVAESRSTSGAASVMHLDTEIDAAAVANKNAFKSWAKGNPRSSRAHGVDLTSIGRFCLASPEKKTLCVGDVETLSDAVGNRRGKLSGTIGALLAAIDPQSSFVSLSEGVPGRFVSAVNLTPETASEAIATADSLAVGPNWVFHRIVRFRSAPAAVKAAEAVTAYVAAARHAADGPPVQQAIGLIEAAARGRDVELRLSAPQDQLTEPVIRVVGALF